MKISTTYEAASSSSLDRFDTLKRATHCPFALNTILWGSYVWQVDLNLEENIAINRARLLRFTEVSQAERLDGFVFEIANLEYGRSVDALAKTVKRFLGGLSRQDPTGIDSLEPNIEDHHWRFSFNTVSFFVAAFAPCYSPNHSRFSHMDRTSFIVLQPKHSFVRKIHGTAHNWTQERSTLVKENIRKMFRLHSSPYDIAIAKQPVVALRYVQPAKIGDDPVRWWE